MRKPRSRVGVATIVVTFLTASALSTALAPASAAESSVSPQPPAFGQPYVGTGNLADTTGVSFPAEESSPSPASFSPNSIIGADTRKQITATTVFPWSAVVHISFVNAGKTYGCTGFMYGASAVVTAAHCLWDRALNTNSAGYIITPGANGSSAPYGSCGASGVHFPPSYKTVGGIGYDYGSIRLNCTVGNATGWFGFAYPGVASLTLAGYPCDKLSKTLWGSAGSKTYQDVTETDYDMDTAGCESGAPVFEAGSYVLAVHSAGSTTHNAGVSLIAGRQNDLRGWM